MAQVWSYRETCWLQEGHRSPLYGVAFNFFSREDGEVFATAGSNRASVYRCLSDGQLETLQVFTDADPAEEYYVCRWTLDSATGTPLLLLAGKNGLLQVVDCARGLLVTSFEGHGSSINDVAVHPRKPHLVATASRDQSLRVWDLRSRACLLVFQGEGGHRNEVLSLDWKPGPEDMLVSAGMDNTIKVWSLAPYRQVLEESESWQGGPRAFPTRHVPRPAFSTEAAHWNYVDCVRWLGDCLLSKSVDNRIVQWQPDTSSDVHRQEGHLSLMQELELEDCEGVWWVRFAMDYWCSVLAQGTATGRVLLYDPHAVSPAPRARLKPKRAGTKGASAALVRQTAVSYDGGIVVSAHQDGSITRYDRVPKDGAAGAEWPDPSDAAA